MSSTLALLLALAPLDVPAVAEPLQTPDSLGGAPRVLLHGGRIYLGDGAGSVVEALLIENGRVVAAGTEGALGDAAEGGDLLTIDLEGATAVPGLQDSHTHVLQHGLRLTALDLSGAANTAAVVEALQLRAAQLEAGRWVMAYGLAPELVREEETWNAEGLEELLPDHPVYVLRADGHAAWVDSDALVIAGLDGVLDPAPRTPGGAVVLDDEGRATGELIEEALGLVEPSLLPEDPAGARALIEAAQDDLLAQGLTCVHDMGLEGTTLEAYRELGEEGALVLRVIGYMDGESLSTAGEPAQQPSRRFGRFLLKGAYFKLDGSLETHTAALLEPYEDRPEASGDLLLSEERLTALVNDAWRAGLQPVVSAVGDRANRVALDVFERLQQVDEAFLSLRPRIEHAQVISPRDIPRFPAMEVVPSMQPLDAIEAAAWIEGRLGEVRTRGAYAWRSLAPGVLELAFGSGGNAQCRSPLAGIAAARTRGASSSREPLALLERERLDGRGALAGYTTGASYAAHQEKERGRLTPGYWADVTVLDTDPVEAEAAKLEEARVLLTMIEGKVVFRR